MPRRAGSVRRPPRYYGRFERTIPLPDVDEERVNATFGKGVLTVILPRSAQAEAREAHPDQRRDASLTAQQMAGPPRGPAFYLEFK